MGGASSSVTSHSWLTSPLCSSPSILWLRPRLLLPAPEKYTENFDLQHLTVIYMWDYRKLLQQRSSDKLTQTFICELFHLGLLFLLSCYIQHVRQQTVVYIHFIKHTKHVRKSKIFKTFSAVWWNNIHSHCCLFLMTSADISGSSTITLSALVPFNSELQQFLLKLIWTEELSGLFLGEQRHLVTTKQKLLVHK